MSDTGYLQHLTMGGELLRADRIEEARGELETALKLKPNDGKILNLLGLAYFRLGQYGEALRIYNELLEKQGGDAALRLNLGLVHLKMGAVDAAIDELERSRALDPSQGRTLGYLGLAWARKGEYARAREAFLKAGQDELAREMEQYLPETTGATSSPPPIPADALAATAGGTPSTSGPTGVPVPMRAAVSAAVRAAQLPVPAEAAISAGEGHATPVAVGSFATSRLIRPDDGNMPFEIAAGGTLIARVRGRILSRTEGVIVSGGTLAYEPATRRMRGKMTDEPFGSASRPMFFVAGQGHLLAAPRGGTFTALHLSDDILYAREDLVFAFEEQLRWENGGVPGSNGAIQVVQFRGEGCVALRTRRPPLAVKLAPDKTLYVDVEVLAGWIGRVVPRVVAPAAAGGEASTPFVECTGEGVVLVEEPEDEPSASAHLKAAAREPQ